jgi:FkbM family methyltransferase
MKNPEPAQFGVLAPGWLDRLVLALTCPLPHNWLGLRLAILLRRAVTMRLDYPDGALDVVRWGMRMRLHPRDNGCEKNLLFTPRMYEPIELNELATDIARVGKIGAPFVFVDIGANVGLFSLFVAAQAGSAARILAVEPEPGNLSRLDFNIRANPNLPIKIIPTALSDEAGNLAIDLDRRDRGGSRTKRIVPGEMETGAVPVPAQTLLSLLFAEGIDTIDALKIDVEGYEDVILQPFFRAAPPSLWPRLIIIEDSCGSWKVDLMAILSAKGYSVTARAKQNFVLRRAVERDPAINSAPRS